MLCTKDAHRLLTSTLLRNSSSLQQADHHQRPRRSDKQCRHYRNREKFGVWVKSFPEESKAALTEWQHSKSSLGWAVLLSTRRVDPQKPFPERIPCAGQDTYLDLPRWPPIICFALIFWLRFLFQKTKNTNWRVHVHGDVSPLTDPCSPGLARSRWNFTPAPLEDFKQLNLQGRSGLSSRAGTYP